MGGETSEQSIAHSTIPRYSAGPVGQQIHSIYKGRLGQFTSNGQYKAGYLMGYVLLLVVVSITCIMISFQGHVRRPSYWERTCKALGLFASRPLSTVF